MRLLYLIIYFCYSLVCWEHIYNWSTTKINVILTLECDLKRGFFKIFSPNPYHAKI